MLTYMSLATLKLICTIVHLIGVACGVGGATVSDLLFFRVLRDRKITPDEFQILRVVSYVVWTSLVLFIISGLGFMYIQFLDQGRVLYLDREPFLAKLTIFGIILINAFIFHLKTIPLLRGAVSVTRTMQMFTQHRLLFALTGSISIVGWYTLLVLGVIRLVNPLSYLQILLLYIACVLCATTVAYLVLKLYTKKSES